MKKFLTILLLLFSVNLFADDDEDKLKLAVMEFEDLSKTFSPEMLSGAAEYLRSAFANSNKFLLIAKESQEKALIAEMKKESYKECNDKNCQIPLGQALSADTILRTTINFFGGVYTITSEFIDLAKEATVIAAKEKFDGSEKSLMEALDKIEEKITGFAKQKDKSDNNEENQQVKPVVAEEKAEVKPAEPQQSETTAESKPEVETYRPYKITGISLIAAGAAVVVAGVAAFHVLSDKEYDKYKNMAKHSHAESSSAESADEYIKKADKYRKNSDTYRILEITSGAVGGALLVSGVVLTLIKKEKTDEKVSLSNFSLLPSNDGFYASLGFEF